MEHTQHITPTLGFPALTGNAGPLTMSTVEIAEVTDKRHPDVMRDARKMLSDLGEPLSKFAQCYRAGNGRDEPCFALPKRETLILVSGYSVELRAKIIDRWMELEEAAARPDAMAMLNDPAAMRGILLTYTERVMALEGKVDELTPKADALDRIASADGSLCITDAAKTLQVRPKDLFTYLRSNGWIYKRPGTDTDVGYQSKLVAGLLEHKTTTVHRPDGTEKVTTQVRVTPKGLTVLAKLLPPVAEEVR